MNEPCVGATIARWIDRLFAPLQETLRVRERSFLFRVSSRGKEKHFRFNLFGFQFTAFDLSRVTPKSRRLSFDHVSNDKPSQFRHGFSLQPRVRRADSGVLPNQK